MHDKTGLHTPVISLLGILHGKDSSYIQGLGGKAQSEDQTQVTSVQSKKYGDMGKYIIILFVF